MEPQIVKDENGKKLGVFIPYKDYKKIMKELEEAADERAYDRAMRRKQELIPAEEAFKTIESKWEKNK